MEQITTEDLKILLAKLAHLALKDHHLLIAMQSIVRNAEANGDLDNIVFGHPEPEIKY